MINSSIDYELLKRNVEQAIQTANPLLNYIAVHMPGEWKLLKEMARDHHMSIIEMKKRIETK